MALEREREIRAVRVQLAQTEAHLEEQLDIMVENIVSSKKKGRTGRKDEQIFGDVVGNTPEENIGNPSELFVGEAGGMIALQVCYAIGGSDIMVLCPGFPSPYPRLDNAFNKRFRRDLYGYIRSQEGSSITLLITWLRVKASA